jgi:ribosomal protein S1
VEHFPGQIIKAKVVKVTPNEVLVDVGGKSEGVVPLKELAPVAPPSAIGVFNEGEELELLVLREEEDGQLTLSKKRVDQARGWQYAREDFEALRVVRATVVGIVKGGVLVELHRIRGFVPASQLRFQGTSYDELLGQELHVKIIELDQRRNKLILSQRKAIEDEKSAIRAEVVGNLEEGAIIRGKVVRLVDFGAFIDVGGIDGLLPISEIAWRRLSHPSELLTLGQEVEVKVYRIDREQNRVSLSLKQLLTDPWEAIIHQYNEGQTITGRVTKLAPFGAFVEVADGVEALLPTSEVAEGATKIEDYIQVDQEITALIKRFRPQERRIGLSLKDMNRPAPEKVDEDKAPGEEE